MKNTPNRETGPAENSTPRRSAFFAARLAAGARRSLCAAGMICLLFMAWGCSSSKAVGAADPDGKPLTWAAMNMEERKAHMRHTVVPRAGEVFSAWRPQRFASIDCSLCHGAVDRGAAFDMPTAHLPRLSGDVNLGPERAGHPDTTALKLNRLVPVMAEALGVKRFNLATRRGFGCYSCHLGPRGPLFGN